VQYQRVCIESVAHHVPPTVVTTADLEAQLAPIYQRMGIKPGFLEGVTGIRARRFWDPGVQPSKVATVAAQKVLVRTRFPRENIGALISTSVCKDYLEPSTASLVHGNLRLPPECLNFDVGNACLGFMTGMSMVANMIELGQIQAGLVVAGEGSRAVTEATMETLSKEGVGFSEFKDHLATLTLGSGACAMLLVHERLSTVGHRLLGGEVTAATEHNKLCIGTEKWMRTDPAKLLSEGVKLASRNWRRTRDRLGLRTESVAQFALHQVGKANHDAVVSALGLPAEKALRVYPEFGNVGAAGIPLTLSMTIEANRLHPGDTIALMGIGSGLNSSMMGVRW
jgi:3-oxoacyl-[acyl-carrier-protein] synthase-3